MMEKQKIKTVLAYIGDEQLAWGRQAYARSKHYYVMPAVLYLAEVLDQRAEELDFERPVCLYFNRSAEDAPAMIRKIIEADPCVVGLSCYSWNLADSLALASGIKEELKDTAIVLGGPGVSFVDVNETQRLLEQNPQIDAIVCGEGESVAADLFSTLARKLKPIKIPNVAYRFNEEIRLDRIDATQLRVEDLPPIDYSKIKVKRTPSCGLAAVFETYRGCPYRCAYCAFAKGKRGIRRFPIERVKSELTGLFDSEIDLIHFSDSVFDISLERARAILTNCTEHNRKTALFCYASFQNIDDEIADLYEKTRIQIGVGLQSWHEAVLERVHRRFSVERFEKNLARISKRKINYYVDVMFGLPGDDMYLFRQTVNRVMELTPPFVMLFPLTVIPGTPFANDPMSWGITRYHREKIAAKVRPVSGMIYSDIGLGEKFDLGDLKRFDNIATALFFSYQRFPLSFKAISAFQRRSGAGARHKDEFAMLEQVGAAIAERLDHEPVDIGDPPNLEGTLRDSLVRLIRDMDASGEDIRGFESLMRVEAGIAALLKRADRPALLHRNRERARRKARINQANMHKLKAAFCAPARLIDTPCRFDSLLRPGCLKILGQVEKGWSGIALAPWDHWVVRLLELGPMDLDICRELASAREVPLYTLERRMTRLKNAETWMPALENLQKEEVIEIFE
jgi:radical SAM superfamily enzyme YgiQ (UPF0313 family)